jgi:phosphoglycerate dehydrogenase-like enzyme
MVTPHVASATVRGRERMVGMAVEQVLMALAGERPTHLVNPEVLESPE